MGSQSSDPIQSYPTHPIQSMGGSNPRPTLLYYSIYRVDLDCA